MLFDTSVVILNYNIKFILKYFRTYYTEIMKLHTIILDYHDLSRRFMWENGKTNHDIKNHNPTITALIT